MTPEDLDRHWMQAALQQAGRAGAAGEVPVGAVIVHRGTVIAAAGNAPISLKDPSAHAEILALREAARVLGNYRLEECEMFVTLEPCAMCAGALLQARLKRLVYALPEPKSGAAGSVLDLFARPELNHHTRVQQGVLAEDCRAALQSFFRQRRREQHARQADQALRQDALRTPDARFAAYSADRFESCYWMDVPELEGLRLHALYRRAANPDPALTVVCLHGPQDWSLAWTRWLEGSAWREADWLCPDLIGFGRSDKPKRESHHSLDWHARSLCGWLRNLALPRVQLLSHPAMLPLARRLAAAADARVVGLALQQHPALPAPARAAPFPDAGHRAGPRAFRSLLAESTEQALPSLG